MGEARAEITINRSADDVWETVGNFGDVTWMPGVERSELDGDDRIVETVGMRLSALADIGALASTSDERSFSTRSRISPAALLVKVTARMASDGTPVAMRCAMRCVMVLVFPAPAPATIIRGPVVCKTAFF